MPANSYTQYTFNNSTHNWYGDQDHGTAEPLVSVSTLTPTYTWSLTANGGGKASINASTGVLTLSGAPTGNITVRLTVSNISPLGDKTVDFTLTPNSVPIETTSNTTIDGLSISPHPCTLDYQGSQVFSVPASPTHQATTTTITYPAHTTLVHEGQTYYYSNGAIYSSKDDIKEEETTHPEITYSWSLSGDGSSALTMSSNSGSSTTVTYASVLSDDYGAILTVNASVAGTTATDSKTATINLNKTLPTSITPDAAAVSICIGDENTRLDYALSPVGCYDHVTVTSSDPAVAEPSTANAFTDGHILIDAGNTSGTATLTLTAATGVTATVTVNVQPKLDLPVITFDNENNQVRIASDVTGATIYYRIDGGTPSTTGGSGNYSGPTPVTLTISSQVNVNAFATMDGYCSNTNTFASKIIPKLNTPTLNVGSDGKVMMTFSQENVSGVTIYYTTNGMNPTAATGTVYNGPVTIPSGSTVKAIATLSDHISSDVATLQVTAPAATPEITISSSGSVTIGCGTAGATIYYTTDGSTPDPTNVYDSEHTDRPTKQYSAAFPVTNGVTVKAIATADGYLNSEVAINRYMQASGTDGTTVTLNDAEDHLWSYYSDPDCPIRSLSPADVKITYLGNGIMMTGTTDYTSGAATGWVRKTDENSNYVGSAYVNIPAGEHQDTFVYYKTLERGADTQTAWTFSTTHTSAASRCPYTTIPNPFQVRPTYGTAPTSNRASWTGWRGFQCWRLKSVDGGEVYASATSSTALAEGDIINAETEVFFAPNSEYDMKVELEAVWSIAYLVYANNDGNWSIPDHSDKGYERNFVVLASDAAFNFGGNSGSKRISNINRESTVTPYLPNGTSGNNAIGRIRGVYANNNAYNLTLQANTKFENVEFSDMSQRMLTAAGHDLIVGRGCSGTVNYVRGINDDITSPDYTIRLESGTFNYLSFLRGYSTGGNNSTDTGSSMGGTPAIKGVLGCDYDRASNNGITDNLIIQNGAFYGYSVSEGTGITYSEDAFKTFVKSGKIGDNFTINDSYTADAAQAFYIGIAGQRVRGHRQLFMEGGEVASIAGGIDATQNQNNNSVTFRMTGGHVRGVVYGGGARSAAYGNRNLIVTGGTVTGWLGGGCNGEAYPAGQTSEDTYGGITNGLSKVYFGGTAICGGTGSNASINGSVGGTLFGAGKGVEGNTTSGRMSQGTTVVIADECEIERNAYGGGNFGYAQTSTDVFVAGGTVHGSVFGGSNQNNGPVIDITMKGGTIEGGLYGGCNTLGTISSDVTMNINGGQIGIGLGDGETANIHGGGYGKLTVVNGDVNLTLGSTTQTTPGVTVYGDVYGGSALGQVNATATVNNNNLTNIAYNSGKETNVTLNKGSIHGSLYGGALGDASTAANVYGPVTVVVNGGSVTLPDQKGGVFGCNNVNGAPQSTVTVTVNGTDDEGVDNVFGGGNHANYDPTPSNTGDEDYPKVTIAGGMVNSSVFGGGNEADILGNANVTMTGGTVQNRVFGGGNLGNVGTISRKSKADSGHTHSGDCLGSPNTWTANTGKCTVTISGGKVGKDHLMMPQDFGYVFGASRGETGDPNMTANRDIEFTAYVRETEVTIKGTAFIIGGVYGGSENGHVRGDTYVYIQENCQIGCGEGKTERYTDSQWTAAANAVKTGDADAIIAAAAEMPECPHWKYQDPYLLYDEYNAYPGGSTTGYDGHTFYGNVFGGGSGYWPYAVNGNGLANGYHWLKSAGLVEGDTHVEITGGHILTSVYGGNELTDVEGNCYVKMSGGTLGVPRTVEQISAHPVTCYLFGAGKGDPRIYFNQFTNVANVFVEVNDSISQPVIFGSVFGGGEDGHVLGDAVIEIETQNGNDPVIGTWGTSYVEGNIFGGGRGFNGDALTAGVVSGNVKMYIKGGQILGSIYGGGRLGSVGTYLVPVDNSNYGALIPDGKQQVIGGADITAAGTTHGHITINISGGTIGNSHEYKVPTGNWTQSWKDSNNIPYTEFGSADSDKNRLMHTKGGNVFAGCMGRLYKLNGTTLIPNWPDMGKARKTVLNISGGTIKSNVYGGGELGAVEEGTTVSITGGIIGTEVYDGTDALPTYTFGSVFGGGYGSDRNVTGTLRSVVNARDYAGLVTGNTSVTMSAGHVWGSVYGGGELAKVTGNTTVSISGANTEIGKNALWVGNESNMPSWANPGYVRYGGYRMGNVFGGGKGTLDYTAAGQILGNATVNISGGKVYHNVYGGGALGSVGTYTYDSGAGNTTCTTGTGTTTVTITGGQIGINGYDNGMVNGSSRGAEGDPKGTNVDNVAWVNNSIVNIGTEGQGAVFNSPQPQILGSVYGGGENGHNYGYTEVNIFSGTVGNTDPAATWQHGHVYGAGCGTDNYEYDTNHNGTIEEPDEIYQNPMAGIVHGTATLNIKGGHIVKAAYGGGSLGSTESKATVNVTGGRIGSVYGGPKGKEGAKAEDNAKFAYCGVAAEVNINYANTPASDDGSTTHLIVGSVFGGGEAGTVEGDVTVNMKKGLVLGDLYGGGALADTNIDNAQYYGQTNETVPSTAAHKTTVNLTGGVVSGNVYGGALGRKASATETANPAYVYGDVLVELNKTIATDDCVVRGVIHGANNYNGSPKGDVTVHIYKTVDDGANVKAANKDNTTYNLKAVYGGGNEAAYIPVSNQAANVIIEGCSLTSIETVYGGGNAASVPATSVVVNSCYEIGTIFGGGNGLDPLDSGWPNPGAHVGYKAATYTQASKPATDGEIAAYYTALNEAFDSQKSGLVYGSGLARVNALGGTIHHVYGGSNTRGNVRDESVAYLDQNDDSCPLVLGDVYGGGNQAEQDGGSEIILGCINYLKEIYGGANAADVGGDVTLNITSGTFDRVYGGNNASGVISGAIKVNIDEKGCYPVVIGELYGCGNNASYETPSGKDDPVINVKSFTSIGRIFGGGRGARAKVTGDPTINIDVALGKFAGRDSLSRNINYHDDSSSPSTVTSTVALPAHEAGKIGAIGSVFGGGNEAEVEGDIYVNVGTHLNEYVAVSADDITVGTTDVSRFYTRSGTEGSYEYAIANVAQTGTTYYERKDVYTAVTSGITVGTTDVSDYFTRSGAGTDADPYVYAAANGLAVENVTYYERSDEYTAVTSGITEGTTDVSKYYTRSGDAGSYVYTPASVLAADGVTYYEKVIGVNIIGNVFGGGNNATVTGTPHVTIGKID